MSEASVVTMQRLGGWNHLEASLLMFDGDVGCELRLQLELLAGPLSMWLPQVD